MAQETFAKDTSSRTMKQWAQGIFQVFVGLTIAHLGVSMFLISELGTDTFTIFIQGLARATGLWTIGTWHVMILIGLMVLMFVTTKGYIKPGTVVCAFCGGWIIDLFLWIFGDRVSAASPMWLRLVVLLLGLVILSFGMSIAISSNTGVGPNDLIAIILSDKINKVHPIQFRYVRIGCDVFFVVIGFFLGGTIGIGTVIAAVLTGPIVQFFLPYTKKITARIFPELL